MTVTTTDLRGLAPIDRATAIELGRAEYARFADALRELDDHHWERPTDCTGWTVRDLAGHVVGMMSSVSRLRSTVAEQFRSARRARKSGIDPVDAMTAIQVGAMAGLGNAELLERFDALIGPAVAGRARVPERIARTVTFPQVVDGATERWSVAHLTGIILTRDTWLHRVADLARATDRSPVLDPDHDGRIVADVAAEWSRRHGQDVELHLGGPAGGRFRAGDGGPRIEHDAIEFCRILSGRAQPSHTLLETRVPF